MKTYSQYFITKKRGEEEFICLSDDKPSYLHDFIRSVHLDHFDGTLPNDWIYRIISQAFDELESNDNDIDNVSLEADPYYSSLHTWLQEPYSIRICDDYLEEFYSEGGYDMGMWDLISGGQWLAKRRICDSVHLFLLENRG